MEEAYAYESLIMFISMHRPNLCLPFRNVHKELEIQMDKHTLDPYYLIQ